MGWYHDYYSFPRAAPRPKAVAGKERKKFGETWWGKQWVEILSEFESDQRMSRGRAYARANKVRRFKIDKGKISATVNGSLGDYKVKIKIKKYSDKDWNKIALKIRDTPLLLGKLLNQEMPEELHDITKFRFIPSSFSSECSCPDYANPCKHVAAVFYTVADEIDHDPMNLFLLQGMGKEELFSRLEVADAKQSKSKEKKLKEKITLKPTSKKKEKKRLVTKVTKVTKITKKRTKRGKHG
ncbi:MAG: SWIM zinc finger family protein [Nanoarchaeota archaeon]